MAGRRIWTPLRAAAVAGGALLSLNAARAEPAAGAPASVLAEIGGEKGAVNLDALRLFLAAQAAVMRSAERQAAAEAAAAFASALAGMARDMDAGAEEFAAWRGSWLTKLSLTATAAQAFASAVAAGDGSPRAASEAAVLREVSGKFSETTVRPEKSARLVFEAAGRALAVVDGKCLAATSDAVRATAAFIRAASIPGAAPAARAVLDLNPDLTPDSGHGGAPLPEPDLGAEFALWTGGIDTGSAAWELVSGGAAWAAMVAATPAVTAAMTTVGTAVATGAAVMGAGALASVAAPLFFAAGLGFAGVASYSVETAADTNQTAQIAAASKAAVKGMTVKLETAFRPRIEGRARRLCGGLADKLSAAVGGPAGTPQ